MDQHQHTDEQAGRRRLTLLALLALACETAPRGAAATAATAASPLSATPVLAALVDMPPWNHVCPSGRVNGIMAEFIEQMAQLSGVAIACTRVPYAREVVMLEHGEAALSMALQTAKIDDISITLNVLGPEEVIVISRAGPPLRAVAELRGKRVAQLRYSDYLAELIADPLIAKYDTVSYDLGVKMLLAGRVDAVIGLRTSLLYAARANGMAAELEHPLVLRSGSLCLVLSRHFHDAATAARLQAAARTLIERGVFEALRTRYRTMTVEMAC